MPNQSLVSLVLPLTRAVSTATTQRPNSILRDKRARSLPDKRSHATKFRSTNKSMLVVVLSICKVVYHEVIPQRQSVNMEYYCDVLRHLRENIQHKDLNCGTMPPLYSMKTRVSRPQSNSHHSPPLYSLYIALCNFSCSPN